MKRVLFVATITGHIIAFHLPMLKAFKEAGYETYVCSNGEEEVRHCDHKIEVPFERSPFSPRNLKAYAALKKLVKEVRFDIVSAHTPVGGILARAAFRKYRKSGTKVFYTAHGFHFYNGAPLKNYLVYANIERFFSRVTDVLITINSEDYNYAKKHFKQKSVYQINGMGVSKEKFYRAEGERPEGKTLICIGEFNDNKNQAFLIRAMRKLPDDVKLLLLGEGVNLEKYRDMVDELDLTGRVEIVGRVPDARPYIVRAAVGTSVSIREGFGIAACEEMICGLPVVLSDNRGHNELVSEDGREGFLIKDFDEDAFAAATMKLFSNKPLYEKMSKAARERALSDFELEVSTGKLREIYGI